MPKLESEVMVQRGAMITISTNSRANVVLRQQSDACGERAAARVCSPLSLSNRPNSRLLRYTPLLCIRSTYILRLT